MSTIDVIVNHLSVIGNFLQLLPHESVLTESPGILPYQLVQAAPTGDLLSAQVPTTDDFEILLNAIDKKISFILHIGTYVITICSILSTLLPPALPSDFEATDFSEKLRKLKAYAILRNIVSVCGSNVGWARNLTSPGGMKIIRNVILGLGSAEALKDLGKASEELAEKKEEEEEKDKVDKASEETESTDKTS